MSAGAGETVDPTPCMTGESVMVVRLRLLPGAGGSESAVVTGLGRGRARIEGDSVLFIVDASEAIEPPPEGRRISIDIRLGDVIHWVGRPLGAIWMAGEPRRTRPRPE